jgi:hypothetical protein
VSYRAEQLGGLLAPTNLVVRINGGRLTATCAAAAFGGVPSGYLLEVGTATGLSNIATLNTGSTATAATFNGVPPGTYYVRIRTVNALGRSVVSNERVVTVQ